MNTITSHVLDTSVGKPAANVMISLEIEEKAGHWSHLSEAKTNSDGRVKEWETPFTLKRANYRLTFQTGTYFTSQGKSSFYPYVSVAIHIEDANAHYHIPLLLNGFGYSTYRGT